MKCVLKSPELQQHIPVYLQKTVDWATIKFWTLRPNIPEVAPKIPPGLLSITSVPYEAESWFELVLLTSRGATNQDLLLLMIVWYLN